MKKIYKKFKLEVIKKCHWKDIKDVEIRVNEDFFVYLVMKGNKDEVMRNSETGNIEFGGFPIIRDSTLEKSSYQIKIAPRKRQRLYINKSRQLNSLS